MKTKLTPEVKATITEHLLQGVRHIDIAKLVNVTAETISKYAKDHHPELKFKRGARFKQVSVVDNKGNTIRQYDTTEECAKEYDMTPIQMARKISSYTPMKTADGFVYFERPC